MASGINRPLNADVMPRSSNMAASVMMMLLQPAISSASGLPPPRIGPVAIGQSESQVEAELGKPLRRQSSGDALDPELRYDGLSVWLWDGGPVAQIRSSQSRYCTPDDICPGMDWKKARELLAPRSLGANTYKVDAETCWLEIEPEGNAVGAVTIKCQP